MPVEIVGFIAQYGSVQVVFASPTCYWYLNHMKSGGTPVSNLYWMVSPGTWPDAGPAPGGLLYFFSLFFDFFFLKLVTYKCTMCYASVAAGIFMI